MNLVRILANQLVDTHCRARSKDTKVRSGPAPKPGRDIAGLFSYPDLVVVCGQPELQLTVACPWRRCTTASVFRAKPGGRRRPGGTGRRKTDGDIGLSIIFSLQCRWNGGRRDIKDSRGRSFNPVAIFLAHPAGIFRLLTAVLLRVPMPEAWAFPTPRKARCCC